MIDLIPVDHDDDARPDGPRVLVIDDDWAFAELVAWLLKDAGCAVDMAQDPLAGLELAKRFKPDVLLLDFNMPRANGFELIEKLRAEESLASVPRIMISGSARLEQLNDLLRWDASEILSKPVRKAELLGAVGRAVGRKLVGKG